jgi:hypothetical protein
MVSRLSGHSSRTLHSATPAPNTPPISRLSPLLRTLSDMGQAATKLGHGGACVATPKHAPPWGKNCIPPTPAKKISRRCSSSPDLARDARSDRRARRSPRASREARPRPRAPPLARAPNAHPPRPRSRFCRSLVPSSTVSNSSFFYPACCRIPIRTKTVQPGLVVCIQGAGNSTQQPRLSRSPFPSLASSLPPDIEETGWGVPLYDEDVVERARTPRTSMDKPPSRRNSVDERHAPALKSLDLSTVRNKIADPPLR